MSVTKIQNQSAAPYQRSIDEVVADLGTDAVRGLSHDEARTRLERDGPNELTAKEPVPGWRRFLAQFADVLVLLLIGAAAISGVLWAVERDSALPYEAMAIFAVVLLNAVMEYVQESWERLACAPKAAPLCCPCWQRSFCGSTW